MTSPCLNWTHNQTYRQAETQWKNPLSFYSFYTWESGKILITRIYACSQMSLWMNRLKSCIVSCEFAYKVITDSSGVPRFLWPWIRRLLHQTLWFLRAILNVVLIVLNILKLPHCVHVTCWKGFGLNNVAWRNRCLYTWLKYASGHLLKKMEWSNLNALNGCICTLSSRYNPDTQATWNNQV